MNIRKELEKWEEEDRRKYFAEMDKPGARYAPDTYKLSVISEKIDLLAELLDDKLESLKEELKQC